LLHAHREADRVLHAVTAPRGADAALHGADALAVGVAALEAGVDELLPDVGELLDARAEQVDALPAGDLRIQAVLLGDLGDHQELVRSDLARRDPRHDRVRAAALDVGQEPNVGVLDRRVARDGLGVDARQDRGDGRLAHLTAVALPSGLDHLAEAALPADLHEIVQLLAALLEVLTQRPLHDLAASGHLRVEDVRHQGQTPAAAGARLGAFLDRLEGAVLVG